MIDINSKIHQKLGRMGSHVPGKLLHSLQNWSLIKPFHFDSIPYKFRVSLRQSISHTFSAWEKTWWKSVFLEHHIHYASILKYFTEFSIFCFLCRSIVAAMQNQRRGTEVKCILHKLIFHQIFIINHGWTVTGGVEACIGFFTESFLDGK